MQDTLFNNFMPKLDAHEMRLKDTEHRIHNLERKFDLPPKIDVEISGNTADFVLENARKVYDAFPRANLNLKVTLKEVE